MEQQVLFPASHDTTAADQFAVDVQNAVRRHMVKLGRSKSTRYDQCRRVMTLHRLGFPWGRFWDCNDRHDAEDLVLDWMTEMQDQEKTDTALDNYAKLLNICGKIRQLDGFHIHKRTPPRKQFVALTPAQIGTVLDEYQHQEAAIQARNLAIFALSILADTRRGEPARMSLEDLDVDRQSVFVKRSKNKVSGWVPVHRDLWPYVQAWLDVRPQPGEGDRLALFTTVRHPIKPLAAAGVYRALMSMGRAVGVKVNSTITRHTAQKRKAQARLTLPTRRYTAGWTNDVMPSRYDEQGFDEAAAEIAEKAPGLRGPVQPLSGAATGGGDGCCPMCRRPWNEQEGIPRGKLQG